jgi:2-keto-4-pentenoate hydratase/2-oxohepta-3-ene-1,7-dioic acid hydratase in catechol pathway
MSSKKYVRFRHGDEIGHGVLDGDTVRGLRGGFLDGAVESGRTYALSEVKLLFPVIPSKVLCVGLNYRSHLGERKVPERPEMFYKPVSALQDPEGEIVIPREATNVHYEGELVVVIGKRGKDLSPAQAADAIFGVTCGNDVSEREWQQGPAKDVQWWRAKGSDTFAPFGPAVVTGLDHGHLLLQTRLNGEVVQKQTTADLIFDCPTVVGFVSRFVTLLPGDIIYTGTPGQTRKMKPGDVVEVELEGVGVLRNKVV